MKSEVEIQLIVTLPMIIANLGVIVKMFLDKREADTQRKILTDKVDDTHKATTDLTEKLVAHMEREDAIGKA
jgi:hypothetical protein